MLDPFTIAIIAGPAVIIWAVLMMGAIRSLNEVTRVQGVQITSMDDRVRELEKAQDDS